MLNCRRQLVPVVVWLSAAATAAWMFVHRSSTCELTGIARSEQRAVSALANGRLRLVPVALLEAVKEGQPLAVLEDDQIKASLATAAAEAARIRSELVATEERLTLSAKAAEAEHLVEARRYAIDVENKRLRELELQVEIETDRIKLDFLRIQKDLLGRLRGQQAVSELRFKSAEADYKALEQKNAENQRLLAEVRAAHEQARQRQESFARTHAEPPPLTNALAPLRAAVTVQERRIAELALEHSMLILKSPIDGIVSQLLRGAGESVRTGESILTVVATRPSAIITYVSPVQVSEFEVGTSVQVQVVRDGVTQMVAATAVQAIGPEAEQLPARLWRSSTIPEWGWPVKIAMPPELDVLGGEVVGIAKRRSVPGIGRPGSALIEIIDHGQRPWLKESSP